MQTEFKVVADMEGISSLPKATITVTTAEDFSREVRKLFESPERTGQVIEYVTTSSSIVHDSLSGLEYVEREPAPSCEGDEIKVVKKELKKKIDEKNWLKASNKPWLKTKDRKNAK